jgi:uncharacterized protein (DUF1810 family)
VNDPFDLQRFLDAQQHVYSQALGELMRGQKVSHWMWFIFPQMDGLGQSAMAHRYGIKSQAEARAYLLHQVLGERLRECTRACLSHSSRSAREIFGTVDEMKFRSSLTLFAKMDEDEGNIFQRALGTFFEGPDEATLALS